MTVMTSAPPLPAVVPPSPVRRFTVDEYHQLIRIGVNPTGPVPAPNYRTRQDYKAGELVPFVLDNQALGPIAAKELLP